MADSDDRNSTTGNQNTESTDASITMKADATNEDACKQDNADNEMQEEDFKMCSPTNRSSMNAETNPFAPSSVNKTNNILKPPQLSLNNNANNKSKSFILCPSRLSTVVKKTDDTNNSNSCSSSSSSSSSSEKKALINGETPKFVPLIHSSTTQSTPSSTSTTAAAATTATVVIATPPPPPPPVTTTNSTRSTTSNSTKLASSFVFGQNLRDRVIVPSSTTTKTDNVNNNNDRIDEAEPSTSVNSNGTTEMLFSSAIKNEKRIENTATTTTTTINNKETKSLSETAREYEESRANKRKYEEVEVVTGEEGETNILNITCKLFAFDKGSWQERGRGVLRLNDLEADDKVVQSRLVFRCTGSFRVVLNTKIWADMTVEKASERSVRFTALDADGEIKIYLVMASFDDARQMFTQIQNRVQKEMSVQKLKKVHTSSTAATTTTTDKE